MNRNVNQVDVLVENIGKVNVGEVMVEVVIEIVVAKAHDEEEGEKKEM
jgi:hypothetical protein